MGRKSLTKKRKPISDKVKEWLGELLVHLQYENLENLTMDDMARIAGKSKSTIYEYFESKEEIVSAACKTRINKLSASIFSPLHQKLGTVELYAHLVEGFAEGTAGISISFLQGVKQHYPAAWSIIDQFTDDFVEILKEHYKQGMSEGIYNAISVDLLGHIDKIFVIQVVTNPAIFSDEQYTISNLIRDYLNLRLTGLLKR